jgi:hypothetical protein
MSFPDGVRYVVTDGAPWLEFFDDENPNPEGAPFIRQDVKPDGSAWSSVAEVTAYAEACMDDWRNPPPPPAPEITPEIEAALIAAGWAPPEA